MPALLALATLGDKIQIFGFGWDQGTLLLVGTVLIVFNLIK
jgi:hypothetical protein